MAEKMCPVIKTKWLEALRSGRYRQTKGVLKDAKGFCCLGVLSDIYAKEHNVEWEKRANGNYYRLYYTTGVLDEPVRLWARLESNDPESNKGQRLSEINDNEMTFNTISEIIETDF